MPLTSQLQFTVTETAADEIPLVTIKRLLSPVSVPADTVKLLDSGSVSV
jgi:hypothetical protein